MNDAQSGTSTGKAIALVVIVAIVTAVVVTLAQVWIRGNSSAAVTGGGVGAVTAVMAISTMRKKVGLVDRT